MTTPEHIAPTIAQLAAILNDLVKEGKGHFTWTADIEVIEILDDDYDYHCYIFQTQ